MEKFVCDHLSTCYGHTILTWICLVGKQITTFINSRQPITQSSVTTYILVNCTSQIDNSADIEEWQKQSLFSNFQKQYQFDWWHTCAHFELFALFATESFRYMNGSYYSHWKSQIRWQYFSWSVIYGHYYQRRCYAFY